MNERLVKKVVIEHVAEVAPGFKTFTLQPEQPIDYAAGQYLTFLPDPEKPDLRRSYSITSSPALREPLAVAVKRVENGLISRQLVDHAQPGDVLWTTGNGGLFVLPEDLLPYKQLFFFAAGSGITPCFSLIKTALAIDPRIQVFLIYSNASPRQAAFLPELKTLALQFPNRFHLELLFSDSPDLLRARLHRNLLLDYLQQFFADKIKTLFYVCGPENYMRFCVYTLQERGVSPNNIRREDFVIHKLKVATARPPDVALHTVFIEIGGKQVSISVQYPDSILQAAKRQQLLLPYSCEAGRCGNCVARCLRGQVWHAVNEVLTDYDLKKGLVLTCVGYPVGGDVELRIES